MRPIAILLLVLFAVPWSAFAQTPDAAAEPIGRFIPNPGEESAPSAADQAFTSCFDYYRFGSTPILLSSGLSTVAQGSAIGFDGSITNENAYPLTDVAIYAKVFYRKNPSEKDSFGPDVVDFFVVKDNITLKANETQPLSVTWNVPQNASVGEYQLATFVVSHDRFNMLGLSFSTDIVGNSAKFQVIGSDIGNTRIDLQQTSVSTEVLHAAAYAPKLEFPEDGLPITVHLMNTGTTASEGKVTWKLYTWDTLREENLIEMKEAPVLVPAGGTVPLTYTAADTNYSVYDLLIEYTPSDPTSQKSVQAVRYVNSNVYTPRINFVGATSYPAKKGDTVFGCVHSTGSAKAPNARVEVVALSNSFLDKLIGRSVLAEKSYEGTIPGQIRALAVPLTRDSDSFTVRTRLYQDGKLVDEVSVPYTCAVSEKGCSTTPWIVATIVGIIGLAVLLLWWKKRRPRTASSTMSGV